MEKKKGFVQEFKEFILRGNVMDLAVGIIIGGAFTAIVTSLNNDIISPILGIFGGVDFSELKVTLGSGANAPALMYGNFITAIINFLIIALVIFCLIKGVNKVMTIGKKDEEESIQITTKVCPFCKSEIPAGATKCPNCTSELPEEEATA